VNPARSGGGKRGIGCASSRVHFGTAFVEDATIANRFRFSALPVSLSAEVSSSERFEHRSQSSAWRSQALSPGVKP
jgi:hypothetical protein